MPVTAEAMREAVQSGAVAGEWSACCWAWDYAEAHLSLPSGKEIVAGVLRDYGAEISSATAFRGRESAQLMIMRVCFSKQAKSAT